MSKKSSPAKIKVMYKAEAWPCGHIIERKTAVKYPGWTQHASGSRHVNIICPICGEVAAVPAKKVARA